jgi:ethanolamine utilization microcompartment shell protein EutS
MRMPGPPLSITGSTEGSISFKAVGDNGEVTEGFLDRYSGSATITAKSGNETIVIIF